jgi:hypothetical protein
VFVFDYAQNEILCVLSVVQHVGKEMRKYFLLLGNVLLHFYLEKYSYTFAIVEYRG